MKDVLVLDVSLLAAPWVDPLQLMTEIRALKRDRVMTVVLAPTSVLLPRRRMDSETFDGFVRAVGWRAWLRLPPVIRGKDRDGRLERRLQHVGVWLEENAVAPGEALRVVVVSLELPDELLEVVTWAADQRADGRPTGVRHLLRELGQSVEGLADVVQLHLDRAGGDLWASDRA